MVEQPPDGPDPQPDEGPVTPHATPVLDGQGQLTYICDDGRRYVVGLPPEADEQSVERVMATLQAGGELCPRCPGAVDHHPGNGP